MFTDHSKLITDNIPRMSYGAAVADLVGDSRFLILITGFGEANRALQWDGSKLVDHADDTLADPDRQSIGVAAADLDADGVEEAYFLNTDTFGGPKRYGDRLFDYAGGSYVDLFSLMSSSQIKNLTAGRSVAAVDRTGSGQYGFYVANYGGPSRLYELDDDGYILDVAPDCGLDLVTGGRSVMSLPLFDTHMDIFAANELGPNFLFRNLGNGLFEEVAGELGIGDPQQHGRGIAALDSSGNGEFDIVCGCWEGFNRLFVRENGYFVDQAPEEMKAVGRNRTVIVADFDNDGHEEIFFNNMGQPNRLFRCREDGWQSIDMGDALEPAGLGTGATVTDMDGDGLLELLVTHGESAPQPLSLYRAQPNKHHWLRVLPQTRYGAPARGAIVRLTAAGRTQTRAIDAGSGYLCQMEPVAHFGLADVTHVDRVEVMWPGGVRAEIESPGVNQQLVIEYPVRQKSF